jgi:hypothetical protein
MQCPSILHLCSIRRKRLSRHLMRWKVRALIIVAFLVILTNCPESYAKDLDLLIRYLVPVFLIQNFTAICRINDPVFFIRVVPWRQHG